ncbi:MAG: hypothetical protein IT558_04015, partial [Alphaproteobacteria bacterium]|nr:hypothetical protein [Alphaproteobacteria bacterium]
MLIGNAWGNTLTGGDGDDALYGSGAVYDGQTGFLTEDTGDANDPNGDIPASDDDTLYGGDGNDILLGGEGDDTLDGGDHYYGGDGFGGDTADYSADPDGVAVNLFFGTA